MSQHLYEPIWKKNLPLIKARLNSSVHEPIQMSRLEFEAVGNRVKSKYAFNLEVLDCKVNNNITGTAVARDLARVALADSTFIERIKGKHLKITMTKEFLLHINYYNRYLLHSIGIKVQIH